MTNPHRIPFVDGDFDFWKRFDSGEWEPETWDVLDRFLTPAVKADPTYTTLLDIGAWIGPVTLWANRFGARSCCLEPDPIAFRQLKHNTGNSGINQYHQVAVSNVDGYEMLGNPRFFGDSMSRLITAPQAVGMQVKTITAEQAFHLPNVVKWALVKLDIEGGETRVLPTLAPLCAFWKVPLYVSWHEPWFRDAVTLDVRQSWFQDFDHVEPIREDGWSGFSELLAY